MSDQPAPPATAPDRWLGPYVNAVIVLGAAALVAACTRATFPSPAVWRVLVAGSACGVGDVALLHLRFGKDQHSFTWSEIALVVGLCLLPAPTLAIVGSGAVAIAQFATRRPIRKLAFNAMSYATGVGLAGLVIRAVGVDLDASSIGRPVAWVALAAGALVFFAWNTATVSVAVALSQGAPLAAVARKGLGLSALVWVGNTATAIMLVVIVVRAPAVLTVLPALLAVLFVVYRGYLRAMQQRDMWQILQSASKDMQRVREVELAHVVLDRLPELVGAQFVELFVDHPEHTTASSYQWSADTGPTAVSGDPAVVAGSFWPRLQSEAEAFSVRAGAAPSRQEAELRERGLAMCLAIPLIAQEHCIGGVRVGFERRTSMREAETQVLTTFANHLSSALHNARLFEQIGNERTEFDRILRHLSDGILSLDGMGRVRRWNPAMERVTGMRTAAAVGRTLFEGMTVTTDDGAPLQAAWLVEQLAKEEQFVCSVWLEGLDGEHRRLELAATRTAGDGNDELAVVVVHDYTERKQFESQLAYQAHHDPLTGLPNRTLLGDSLARALCRRRGEGRHVAALFVDLDRFKVINDSLGHEAGDEVLMIASERLTRSLRAGDLAARFGGDEFVVLCDQVNGESEALAIAERLAAALSEPYQLTADRVYLTVSIGVSMAHADDSDPTALLRDADAAMYLAKERGRNRVQLFTDEMRGRAVARLATENDLRRAIEDGELRLHYQPYVSLADRTKAIGAEALVRWHHPRRGIVFPGEFISLAEETGLVQGLGSWVLTEACRMLARSPGADGSAAGRCLSVNVSAHQLVSDQFVPAVAAALGESGVDPGRLCLEITETALIDDMNLTLARLHDLSALGVKLALDDFGTGYSALSHLRLLPVDIVKIDRSFVARINENPRDRAIVFGMVELAHALGLVVIAEGVETVAQADLLHEMGCDLAQGHLFAKPAPAEELPTTLAATPNLRVLPRPGLAPTAIR